MPFVSRQWLKDHVDLPEGLTAEQLAADLVKVGLEEEQIVPPAVTGPLVVGKVLTRDAFEASNGKTINYCRVDVGEYNDEPGVGKEPSDLPSRGIVCGAHNFEAGDYVVVSLPGAVLPGDFAIAARKTYGHISDGMICSARELGLDDTNFPRTAAGIILLDEWLGSAEAIPAPGTDAISILGLGEDLLEINITPDRGYCFSMRGVAREYSHSTGAAFVDPADPTNTDRFPNGVLSGRTDGSEIIIDDQGPIDGNQGCDRYVARVVRGIDPSAPTPSWMADRLIAAGMRPISLAVDVTNYVMLDLGQPLHAFDLDKVSLPIVVRRATEGEKLTTLDDVERTLDCQDLLITDSPEGQGSRVLALAGVMGGASTEVTDDTKNILIEAAHFHPVSIARSARRHKLPTESSKRFERGVDTQLAPVAAQRAVDLLVEYGGGVAEDAVTDLNSTEAPAPISMPVSASERLTGVAYTPERIVELLTMIGCTLNGDVTSVEDTVEVIPPTWRPDLVDVAHLVEEIARLDGYDAITPVLPQAPAGTGLTARQRARRDVIRNLVAQGLNQVLSYPFIGDVHDSLGYADDDPRRQCVRLSNPLADDAPYLRTSILDSLVDVARRNVSRGLDDVALVEVGSVTEPAGAVPAPIPSVESKPSDAELAALDQGIPYQPWHVGIVLAGNRRPAGVNGPGEAWQARDAIDLALSCARVLGVKVTVESDERAPWHPGRCAKISSVASCEVIAWAGELHPRVCKALGLPARACAAELNLEPLFAEVEKAAPLTPTPVSTFPVAKEDFAFVVDADLPAATVQASIEAGAGDLCEGVRLFDIFTGEQVGEGKKSLAFSVRLRGDHTLSAKEIDAVRKKIIKRTIHTCGAQLRG
ncbi:phenylalanine--tRNA ligase subunit beta [Actinomyces vulturis]|uniref:phenylalanine--tRNA ligase subunit beta n=1 Tax=Actinomyces vulturis TaxID=1857645 RepID=UPI00082B024A|nr:phenylalanine--tRNA ligase subunit beta [Actinomyces vulturis]